jgi:hypothetical protein
VYGVEITRNPGTTGKIKGRTNRCKFSCTLDLHFYLLLRLDIAKLSPGACDVKVLLHILFSNRFLLNHLDLTSTHLPKSSQGWYEKMMVLAMLCHTTN